MEVLGHFVHFAGKNPSIEVGQDNPDYTAVDSRIPVGSLPAGTDCTWWRKDFDVGR